MEAPKCKLCGERHYGLCEHAKPRPAATSAVATRSPVVEAPVVAAKKPAKASGPSVKPQFDRNAYQRDLMRKRRAADKAKKREVRALGDEEMPAINPSAALLETVARTLLDLDRPTRGAKKRAKEREEKAE